jgi:hypothetical protein
MFSTFSTAQSKFNVMTKPDTSQYYYFGGGGGISYKSKNLINYITINTNLTNCLSIENNGNIIIAVGQGALYGIRLSTNKGISWSPQTTPVSLAGLSIKFNQNIFLFGMYFNTTSAVLLKSTDNNGTTPYTAIGATGFNEIECIDWNYTYDYWLVGTRSGMYRSNNANPTSTDWTSVYGGLVNGIKWNGSIWIGLKNAATNPVIKSVDGNVWVAGGNVPLSTNLDIGGSYAEWRFDYANGRWFICGKAATNPIYYSIDNGISWTNIITGSLVNTCYSIKYITQTSTWVCCGNTVIKSIDNGNTWSLCFPSTPINNTVFCVKYI